VLSENRNRADTWDIDRALGRDWDFDAKRGSLVDQSDVVECERCDIVESC
jgi:hypothetical protein